MSISPKIQNLLRIALPIFVLALGYMGWEILNDPVEPPVPEKRERRVLKTEVLKLHQENYQLVLKSQGFVGANQSTNLTAFVSGRVKTIHPNFEDGAFFQKGEVLLELDPADFQTSVLSAESALARAEANLLQEEARAEQAALNWKDIGFKEKPSPLVLRIPQLREARANVSAAKADLEKARRDLARSKVRAPFAGRVKERLVGLGQAIGSTTNLGEIFGSETAEIRLPLSPQQLRFIQLPKTGSDPVNSVRLTDPFETGSNPSPTSWNANIVRTEGELNAESRELFAIAKIDDPFQLSGDRPQLRIGQPLRAEIDGLILKGVIVIPRKSLRGINRIFLVDSETSKIEYRQISPIWSNEEVLVIRDGIEPGSLLAISDMPYAPNGVSVQIIGTQSSKEAVSTADEKDPGTS